MDIENIKRTGIIVISTWFGCGFFPFAPGTIASIATLPLLFLLRNCSLLVRIIVLVSMTSLGIAVSEYAEQIFGEKDPKQVVIDEVTGMLVCCLFIPFEWRYIGAGFILFRLLDILKPFPVSTAETLKGGFGIIVDDLIAGVMSYGLMFVLIFFLWHGNLEEFYSFLP
jgi:phosphatidylglycerophosphatase A